MTPKCNTCQKKLATQFYLEVTTPDGIKFAFCTKCCLVGYHTLHGKETNTKEEIELMSQLEDYLKKRKIIHQS